MDRAPDGVDPNMPNVARMYDYYLDGKDNFASDREAAERILQLFPDTKQHARENRGFLRRAVRLVTDNGVDQIVDLGAGLPTQGNTHEIAVGSRVVYVDNDPVVCTHGRALLARGAKVDFLHGDARKPDELLDQLQPLIDFDRPVTFMMLAILHFLSDEEAYGLIARLREVSAPGSYLVLSHAIDDKPDLTPQALEVYKQSTAALHLRTHEEILRFFDGYELLEPGLVDPGDWRPEEERAPGSRRSPGYAGVGHKQ
ncbi:SAM-dependent methyltransferase [Nonomuraea sp. MCN248]|uniref:SAM-dependent methyltransferase n=1 Tax=Nonomuraea corallina TaxID=2989783 RepID=A0ABT4S5U1_9ACTN|nr:SAM-dependent methyltransferase [Nonomuraea corallina]MDA0632554.1 SAM-dependent methyltransferase [Nonomuraea corallina]